MGGEGASRTYPCLLHPQYRPQILCTCLHSHGLAADSHSSVPKALDNREQHAVTRVGEDRVHILLGVSSQAVVSVVLGGMYCSGHFSYPDFDSQLQFKTFGSRYAFLFVFCSSLEREKAKTFCESISSSLQDIYSSLLYYMDHW